MNGFPYLDLTFHYKKNHVFIVRKTSSVWQNGFIIFQYLAIYNYENFTNIKNVATLVQNFFITKSIRKDF